MDYEHSYDLSLFEDDVIRALREEGFIKDNEDDNVWNKNCSMRLEKLPLEI
ncbi:hypothetical protein ACE198_22400 [Neobacillus sp. KR4-4]|uniref:hypothetical protein n=1 Tax=Neobacillus sp. KR4-4 TaxID=3344872 RepID=UPI0035CACA48